MGRFWIQQAIKKPGALRATANTPEGKNIPGRTLNKLSKKKGITGQRARLAQTLKSFKK